MLLKSLELTNFRNYEKYKVNFDRITVFVGKNGVGKSNIVEAIALLGYAKSFRTNHDEALIKYDKPYAQIRGKIGEKEYIFVISKEEGKIKKQIAVSGEKIGLTQLVGKLKIVLFDPESLAIVTGSPKERRSFIDLAISQIDKKYLNLIIDYRKTLRSRNELIKRIAQKISKKNELKFWNEKICVVLSQIIKKRLKFIKFIQKNFNTFYKGISENIDSGFSVKYMSNLEDLDRLEDMIENVYERELMAQKTLFGAHLDDMRITRNTKIASDVCSRGEIRSIVLALKLCEIAYIEEISGEKVILLLDDIFSELDDSRREQVIRIIGDRQAVITTTDEEFVIKNLGKIKLIKL
jgi:DNA replication and repair protein RecF